MRRDVGHLADIVNAARRIQAYLSGVDYGAFERDPMRQDAVIRQLEILGEATKRLSEDFRLEHPDVPWRGIAGMRDILIHAYDHVDVAEVWRVAVQDVPRLLATLEGLLPSEAS